MCAWNGAHLVVTTTVLQYIEINRGAKFTQSRTAQLTTAKAVCANVFSNTSKRVYKVCACNEAHLQGWKFIAVFVIFP